MAKDKDLQITVSFTFAPAEQRAIAHHFGDETCTRDTAREWVRMQVDATMQDLLGDYLDATTPKDPDPETLPAYQPRLREDA